MSLFDVDKTGDLRGNPQPNTSDNIPEGQRSAHGTSSLQYQPPGVPVNAYIQTKNSRILTFDGTSNRLLITPTQVKISKPGMDVTTASNDQLIFNSSQDVFKIVGTGYITLPTVTATVASGKTWATATGISVGIPHGLSFTPIVLGFNPSSNFSIPQTIIQASGGGTTCSFETNYLEVDATNIYAVAQTTVNGTTGTSDTFGGYNIKYYLLQETSV